MKAAVTKYFMTKVDEFKKMGPKYEPELEKLLSFLETELAKQGKGLAVDLLQDIIHIIIDGDVPERE